MFVAVPNDLLTPLKVEAVEKPTVRGLADAYVDNTINLGLANKRFQLIREWSEAQRKIYQEDKNE